MTELSEQKKNNPMWTRRDWILLAINVLIFAGLAAAFYDRLPDQVISHYDAQGRPNDTMAKWSFWLLYGALGTLLPSGLTLIRQIDPRKPNYERFKGYFYLMRYAVSLFLHGIFLIIILDNLDYELPVHKLVIGGIGLLWIVIGNGMGQLRSNFFVGIRTPWTLTDDDNWRKTHRIGGRLWVLAGLIMLAGACFLNTAGIIAALVVGIVLSVVVPVVYSYNLHRKKSAKTD
ncbi:SdpI family protein [Cohnella yongneupensis]|uniref:SdpI family protein n=1 Tax=Cohnella yongneupensis TaxID=425006 RepID=A0ABW0QX93_9BACL